MAKQKNISVKPSTLNSSRTPLTIKGARVHNLKNISVVIPRNKLIVITGVSGSGKSSLAFDTIYAEGQRRYVESLSSYARQFLERMDKPDVDSIQGMSPAISIEQRTNTRNPRSTVATTTEIYDYLRLLYARVGKTICPKCGREIKKDSVQTVVDAVIENGEGAKFYVMFPMHHHEGKTLAQEFEVLKQRGFFRLVIDGEIIDLNEKELSSIKQLLKKKEPKKTDIVSGGSSKTKEHDIYILVDRYILRKNEIQSQNRLADSIQTAFVEGEGYASIFNLETKKINPFSQHFECAIDNLRFEEPEPHLFAFNSPIGACPKCQGFGRSVGIDMDLVVPDIEKTLKEGAILPWTTPKFQENLRDLARIAYDAGVPMNVPYRKLTEEQLNIVMNGYKKDFDGINGFFKMVERKAYKIQYRVLLSKYRGYTMCDECHGSRLRKEALNVKIGGKPIGEVVALSIERAEEFFINLTFNDFELSIGKRILEEIRKRLRYLVDVGVGYLTLDRLSNSLSGGESQRINLATSIGSSLVGSIYVLDEPSIGLHPLDNDRLINILKRLRDVGNTVIVVEHDSDMMKAADQIIDIGPKAGEQGGELIFQGTYMEAFKSEKSLTGKYLSGKLEIPLPSFRRKKSKDSIKIFNAFQHNLQNIDIEIPLKMFVCVTGVSGSGKSTLVHDIIGEGIKKRLNGHIGRLSGVHDIQGWDNVQHLELVDQSPIGRSPRSNPVTYIGVFDGIRELLSKTAISKIHGYQPGYFSFNVPGGRCDICEGDGLQKVEMQFMADLYLTCEACNGKRYKKEALEVRWNGKNVDDILGMTVEEAISFFGKYPDGKKVMHKMQILDDVGLGYLRLGQAATTLSGGEAQRIKLATHLVDKKEGHTLFIFDEPTTGLHFDDIQKLLKCFTVLLDAGNSLIVIEHNLDVIKCADHIIDIGPGGGENGGKIIAIGSPEEISKIAQSYTGNFLKKIL
ncbi:MAG: excinuclease ABC subunit UvrA [Bacteroidota bacterium]|nr:excinuclease ABC subunit UvrA [Bacteroidota bacterium]